MEENMTMYPVSQNSSHVPASRRNRSLIPAALGAALALTLTLGVSNALAKGPDGGYTHGGGYTGPGPSMQTVEQVKGMRDDTHVALTGRIVQHLGGKLYVFQDATGTINVDIDDKHWRGQNVGPNDVVEIYGEVEKDWTELEIDVDRIIKK